MLDKLSVTVFTEYLNTTFRASPAPSATVDLELVEAKELGSTTRQEQFSVLFLGPLNAFLPQGIYPMAHDQLGQFDLFLVPVGRTEAGFQYEAIFNRMIKEGQ